jgi:hypothetical protein
MTTGSRSDEGNGEARVPDPFRSSEARASTGRAAATAAPVELTRGAPNLESSLGHNAKLGKRIVEQACVERLAATRRGRVPENLVDFLNRATVYFLDADGHVVDLDSVMIVWKEE